MQKRLYVTARITERCRERCSHCPYSRLFSASQRDLCIDQLKDLLSFADRYSGQRSLHLTITGGEPVEHPELGAVFDLLRRSQTLAHLAFATNALVLSQNKSVYQAALDSGIDEFIVSIDGDSQSHEQLRGELATFEAAHWLIHDLSRKAKAGLSMPWVSVNVLVHKQNVENLENILRRLEAKAVFSIRLLRFTRDDARILDIKPLNDQEWEALVSKVKHRNLFAEPRGIRKQIFCLDRNPKLTPRADGSGELEVLSNGEIRLRSEMDISLLQRALEGCQTLRLRSPSPVRSMISQDLHTEPF